MKVDKNIPFPRHPPGRWSLLRDVGDSAFLKERSEKTKTVTSANNWGKRQSPPRRFSALYETATGEFVSTYVSADDIVGIRIWRVE